MLPAMEFAKAMRFVYSTGIEFVPESFVSLVGAKLEAFLMQNGPTTEPVYEVIAMEPTAIERIGNERVTIELMIVTERFRTLLLGAVSVVNISTREMPGENIEFTDRLEWLRPNLPGIMTGGVAR